MQDSATMSGNRLLPVQSWCLSSGKDRQDKNQRPEQACLFTLSSESNWKPYAPPRKVALFRAFPTRRTACNQLESEMSGRLPCAPTWRIALNDPEFRSSFVALRKISNSGRISATSSSSFRRYSMHSTRSLSLGIEMICKLSTWGSLNKSVCIPVRCTDLV